MRRARAGLVPLAITEKLEHSECDTPLSKCDTRAERRPSAFAKSSRRRAAYDAITGARGSEPCSRFIATFACLTTTTLLLGRDSRNAVSFGDRAVAGVSFARSHRLA